MHGYGTNLEGPFALVSEAIEKCHEAVHEKGIPRISTDIRIGTRTDKSSAGAGKSTKQEESKQENKIHQTQVAASQPSKPAESTEAQDAEDWTKGLTENQRKKESVRRILSNSKEPAVEGISPSNLEVKDLYAVADFCLLPMGTQTTSVGPYIAECQRTLEGLKPQGIRYEMHGYGTNLEGSFEGVSKAIEKCHQAVHRIGIPRISTEIRIGTRVDKKASSFEEGKEEKENEGGKKGEDWTKGLTENQRKKESVRRILAGDGIKNT